MESMKLKHGVLNICSNLEELVRRLAERIVVIARESIQDHGQFTIALSGGKTPEALYKLLAEEPYRNEIKWKKTHVFFGDERCVPYDNLDSNFRMADKALLEAVPIPRENIHLLENHVEDPGGAALKYETSIMEFFGTPPGVVPEFDLILLGLGPEGHTASLFPENPDSLKSERLVQAVYVEKFKSHRVTFTFKLINRARNVVFLVSGEGKEEILPEVLKSDPIQYPAQHVAPIGNLEWYVDVAAASKVDKGLIAKP